MTTLADTNLSALLIATLLQPETWLIADTHFGHRNIIRYCNRPEDHDTIMAERWRERVGDDEVVLHLGDLVWKGGDHLPELPGQKFMLKGNHDGRPRAWYEERGYTVLSQRRLWMDWEGRRVLFTHEPELAVTDWDINVHGHIHNNGYGREYDVSRDYRNISVEVMDYAPVRLRDVLAGGRFQAIREAPEAHWTPKRGGRR